MAQSRITFVPVYIGDMMVKHTFSGSCRGGPLDGQSLEHHQNVYRIFEPPSCELAGEYWHQIRVFCYWMNLCRRSMSSCGCKCAANSDACNVIWASRSYTS